MISIVEFLVKKHQEKTIQKISKKEFKDILKEGDYIIYVDLYDLSQYSYILEKTYIIKVGDDKIGSEFGQDKYDNDSLSNQRLAGQWAQNESKYTPQNNVLRYLKDILKDDNCCKYSFEDNGVKKCYMVSFDKTKYKQADAFEEIYDARI